MEAERGTEERPVSAERTLSQREWEASGPNPKVLNCVPAFVQQPWIHEAIVVTRQSISCAKKSLHRVPFDIAAPAWRAAQRVRAKTLSRSPGQAVAFAPIIRRGHGRFPAV